MRAVLPLVGDSHGASDSAPVHRPDHNIPIPVYPHVPSITGLWVLASLGGGGERNVANKSIMCKEFTLQLY